ncbi:SDR family NAD(P)-dependent oxidoreductase [Vibrio spartinae]|nr:SDR family oxidoreductase [Vibrio spartinae]
MTSSREKYFQSMAAWLCFEVASGFEVFIVCKTALVTGAANGIGSATVRKLVSHGATHILALDRDQSGLAALVSEMADSVDIIPVVLDLENMDVYEQLLEPYLNDIGQLDTVVISHGVSDENELAEHQVWDKVMNINLNATRYLLSLLEKKLGQGSSVVVISSILAKVGKQRNTAYCSSKHGLMGLVKGLALDWARLGIRVNAVLPSWVDTPMLRRELQKQGDMTGASMNQMLRQIKKRIPLRSLVSAEDIADSIIFLASPQAKMITAQSLVVDGGDGCGV